LQPRSFGQEIRYKLEVYTQKKGNTTNYSKYLGGKT